MRESESSAALATEYSAMFADGRLPAVLETLTTRPHPRSFIPGVSSRISRIGAMTLISNAAYQSSSGTSSRSRHLALPALLTRTSTGPKRSSAAARMRADASGSVTSWTSDSAAPPASAPAATHSSAASTTARSPRATKRTEAPSAQRRRAVSSPMPRLAPVITQVRPLTPRSTVPP
jgi:hypothetical protein